MNKTFTEKKKIELDSNWHLTPDTDYGIVLTFHEIRKKEKTKIELGKKVKTGDKEDYLFEDTTYHTRIAQALRYYVDKSLNNSKSLIEILEKEERLMDTINKLDKSFKQF